MQSGCKSYGQVWARKDILSPFSLNFFLAYNERYWLEENFLPIYLFGSRNNFTINKSHLNLLHWYNNYLQKRSISQRIDNRVYMTLTRYVQASSYLIILMYFQIIIPRNIIESFPLCPIILPYIMEIYLYHTSVPGVQVQSFGLRGPR